MSEISLRVGDATITVGYDGREYDNFSEYRPRYTYTITPDSLAWQYVGNDISGPVNGGIDVESAMASLLGFLSACAESRAYGDGTGENATLFPEYVGQWAEQYSDEIDLAAYEIDPDDN